MQSRLKVWTLALGLGLAAIGGTAWAQADIIAARKDGLKRVGANMEAIKLVVDARGDVRTLGPRVDEIVTFFSDFPTRFPAGSGTGETRALPAIWTDRAGFDRAAANALTAAHTLRTTVNAGDAAATAQAFQALGGACGACHRPFRGR
ncbi:c-type cytochrome [Humitalea sp. 24SJ18S-53]|uniref:c-type cytochrome n=1 Tax=Humitalea sp. 24SJ18S-53 TaxID=3422307 RepID=UPI003D67CEE2